MNIIRMYLSGLNDFLHLRDSDPPRGGHVLIKVACSSVVEQIAKRIRLFSGQNCVIRGHCLLAEVLPSLKEPAFLGLGENLWFLASPFVFDDPPAGLHHCANSGSRVESRVPEPAGFDPLSKSSLRKDVSFHFSVLVPLSEGFVTADVSADHPLQLPVFYYLTNTPICSARVIRYAG